MTIASSEEATLVSMHCFAKKKRLTLCACSGLMLFIILTVSQWKYIWIQKTAKSATNNHAPSLKYASIDHNEIRFIILGLKYILDYVSGI